MLEAGVMFLFSHHILYLSISDKIGYFLHFNDLIATKEKKFGPEQFKIGQKKILGCLILEFF